MKQLAIVLLALWVPASRAGAEETTPGPFEDRVVVLECDDEHDVAELGGPEDVPPPFLESSRHDWLRVRIFLARSHDVVLREVVRERAGPTGRELERWPLGDSPGVVVAAARWDSSRKRWNVQFRQRSVHTLPVLFTEELLQRILGALVVKLPVWDRDAQTTTVPRVGRWRRVGDQQLEASVNQVWTRQAPVARGLVPIGWHGEMTILNPSASPGHREIGRGNASELGTFDPVEGLYQDLTQSWDVEFTT